MKLSRQRSLTAEERSALVARRDHIAEAAAARVAKTHGDARGGVRWVFGVAAFFAAVVMFDLFQRALGAALAASSGVLVFGALGRWLARQPPGEIYPSEADEIRRLTTVVRAGIVDVHELVADAALVIALRGDENEAIGDVLRVGHDVLYVRRRRTGSIPPERLPNRHLRFVESSVDGIFSAEALGARIDSTSRVLLGSEEELFEHLVTGELVEMEIELDELVRRLDAGGKDSRRRPYAPVMSEDVMFVRAERGARSLMDLAPSPPALGPRRAVSATLRAGGFDAVDLGKEDPVPLAIVPLTGIDEVRALCKQTGWAAFDMGSGDRIDQ